MSSGHAVDRGPHNATAKKRERNGATITYTKSEIDEDNDACGQAIVMSKQSRCKTDCAALSRHHHAPHRFTAAGHCRQDQVAYARLRLD